MKVVIDVTIYACLAYFARYTSVAEPSYAKHAHGSPVPLRLAKLYMSVFTTIYNHTHIVMVNIVITNMQHQYGI